MFAANETFCHDFLQWQSATETLLVIYIFNQKYGMSHSIFVNNFKNNKDILTKFSTDLSRFMERNDVARREESGHLYNWHYTHEVNDIIYVDTVHLQWTFHTTYK